MTNVLDTRGIKWPLQFVNGKVATSKGETHVRESILQIIGMNPGEHVMKPTLGCGIHRRVFDTTITGMIARSDVEDALYEWEPRIDVEQVTATSQPTGEFEIHVEYVVRQTKRRGDVNVRIGS